MKTPIPRIYLFEKETVIHFEAGGISHAAMCQEKTMIKALYDLKSIETVGTLVMTVRFLLSIVRSLGGKCKQLAQGPLIVAQKV
jgi:hypothetical protein